MKIKSKLQLPKTLPKINICPVIKDNNINTNTYLEYKEYLTLLTVKKLKILCISFMLSYSGNKSNLIARILNNNNLNNFEKLNSFIECNKHYRYIINCGGFEMIDDKGGEHIYYTNKKIDARKKCHICKCKTFITEYYNEFYKQ
jgi:hypothetical protein